MPDAVSHPLAPIVNCESRILILGSFPSVKSRESMYYYAHPQNRFWPMLASVFGKPLPQTNAEKEALVLAHRLALWDVIASCTVTGSSDASIKDVVPTDIERVLKHASIERVLCNGSLSGKLYHRYLEHVTGTPAMVMPSTSPANAAWSLARLVERWSEGLRL